MTKKISSLIRAELSKQKNPEQSKLLRRFFKTGKGEYAEGDVFWGIMVPQTRVVVNKFYKDIKVKDVAALLNDQVHEVRFAALAILVKKYQRASEEDKKKISQFYLRNIRFVNNWDLVDISAPRLAGPYFFPNKTDELIKMARSKSVWIRRISVLSSAYFIDNGSYELTKKLCIMLMRDPHDLIHKACGWMLREVGKRNKEVLRKYLKKYSSKMPRVMLRYSIEKLHKSEQKLFLKIKN